MNKWNKIKKTDLKSLGEAPTGISENIKAPELAPRDNRFTGRTKRIAFTCRPEFYEELRKLAFEESCYQIEILEKALASYHQEKQIQLNKELQKYRKIIQPKPKSSQLTPYFPLNFICDNCGDEYVKDTAYSYAVSIKEINQHHTYCSDCVR